MKLYLSGPMTFRSDSDWNYPAFNAAAAELREAGHDVFNPAESFGGKTSLPLETYLSEDFRILPTMEAIAMLPQWKISKHATLERFIMRYMGKPVFDVFSGGILNPSLPEPWEEAFLTVREVMAEGLKKHAQDSWRFEPEDNHLDKSARHILTAKLIRDENSPPDGENHLRNALCRLSMAVARRA